MDDSEVKFITKKPRVNPLMDDTDNYLKSSIQNLEQESGFSEYCRIIKRLGEI